MRLLAVLLLLQHVAARNINIDVGAHWPRYSTSFVLELSEFLSDQSPKSFWSYVDDMCLLSFELDEAVTITAENSDLSTDVKLQKLNALAYAAASKIIQPLMHPLMRTMVDIGYYTPAVKFFDSLSSPYGSPCQNSNSKGNAFAVIFPSEKTICIEDFENENIEKIFRMNTKLIKASKSDKKEDLFFVNDVADLDESASNWDHAYLPRVITDNVSSALKTEKEVEKEVEQAKVVLYGVLGTSSFCQLHSLLSVRADAGNVRYSARHAFPGLAGLAENSVLRGYGVFLDIKNMEYKNDETSDAEEKNGENDINDKESEEEKENELKNDEKDKKNIGGVTDVKRLSDLGLQALSSVMNSKEPLSRFTEIVSNFPTHAPLLSRKKVTSFLRSEVSMWYNTGMYNSVPSNAIYVNGLKIELAGATFNSFDFLTAVRTELMQVEKMQKMKISTSVREGLLKVAGNIGAPKTGENGNQNSGGLSMGGEIIRIDVSKGGKQAVTFVNNLEKDAMYSMWSSTMRQLLYPSWSLQSIARNMYTLIVVVNPSTYDGAVLLMQVSMMHQQQYPVRFGIVLDCENPKVQEPQAFEPSGPFCSSTVICRLYALLKHEIGSPAAVSFLFAVSNAMTESVSNGLDASLPKNYAVEMYKEAALEFASTSKNSLFSSNSMEKLGETFREKAIEIVQLPEYQGGSLSENKVSDYTDNDNSDKIGDKKKMESYDEFIFNSSQYLLARGLPSNSYSMNGIVRHESDFTATIMNMLGREQYLLANHFKEKKISDKTKSIFAAVLTDGKAFPRYHSLLEEKNILYADFSTPEASLLLDILPFKIISDAEESVEIEEVEIDSIGNTKSQVKGLFPSSKSSYKNTTMLLVPFNKEGYSSISAALTWLLEDGNGLYNRLSISFNVATANTDGTEDMGNVELINFISLIHKILESRPTVPSLEFLITVFHSLGEGKSIEETIMTIIDQSSTDANDTDSVKLSYIEIESLKSTDFSLISKDFKDARTLSNLFHSVMKSKALVEENRFDDVFVLYGSRILRIKASRGKSLHDQDLVLLSSVERRRIGEGVENVLKEDSERKYNSDDFLRMISFCGLYGSTSGKRLDIKTALKKFVGLEDDYEEEEEGESGKKKISFLFDILPKNESESVTLFEGEEERTRMDSLSVYIVVDPLSLSGQRASSIITLLTDHLKIPVTLILIPLPIVSDYPLQNFYRSLLISNDTSSGHISASAHFSDLPRQHVLTVRMDVPEPWNIQATDAVQDIDNLKCDARQCGDPVGSRPKVPTPSVQDLTRVSYTLKTILVAGQCFESQQRGQSIAPPNGLQLTLLSATTSFSTSSSSKRSDTLVMQNLGYFQLQANPGLWILNLAAGRGAKLFSIDGASAPAIPDPSMLIGDPSAPGSGLFVAVRSFADVLNRVMVTKNPGMESTSLLIEEKEEEEEENENNEQFGSMWKQLGSLLGNNAPTALKERKAKKVKAVVKADDEDNTIHVFSLATGHLYERLLRIMMLSVTKRTSVPVKFWLLENFLSPSFKTIAAAMALEFKFEVEYVTYRWPEWLTQQTAKQRIIWGYKILFLDVLFPLSVKKVIYVDADQVLRADLKELWDTDLEGKPYAYTPFCTSRKETLGFQFWRTGYWADHLRGKPYHISAIYVVDLKKFRRNAVGDQLRAVYDQLARDPNSLANLDQDLPNYAQHVVPIHSLPQEWLWCESWCSDDSKIQAKTIDLCNNPLHKEGKLDMAKRVISGSLFNESWIELDAEVKALEKKKGFGILTAE